VGWNWALEIARFHEVWVITRTNNREPIERLRAKESLPSIHWIYFDLPEWARFWKRGRRGIRSYYFLWQLGAYFIARKLHRQIGLELMHHVTLGIYWIPSFLPLLPIPFVLGPVGGGESAPYPFWCAFTLRGKLYEIFRDLGRTLGDLNPMVRLSARRAVVALCKTEDTKRKLEALGSQRALVYSEVGLPAHEIHQLASSPTRQHHAFRVVSIGNLLHLKGFEFGIRAFALFQIHSSRTSEYWIIGDGPERERLQRLARTLGVAESVHFLGRMPRARVLEYLMECDVLIHPSLHDSGGWVCVEAMAAGRPVICLDLGGPGMQVTEEIGVKIPAVSPPQVIRDLAAAMNQLAQDPSRCEELGKIARGLVQQYYSWDRKSAWINRIYYEIHRGI
jgi:glycosyltransferase involved in cell wall biosynthesis